MDFAPQSCQILLLVLKAEPFILKCFTDKGTTRFLLLCSALGNWCPNILSFLWVGYHCLLNINTFQDTLQHVNIKVTLLRTGKSSQLPICTIKKVLLRSVIFLVKFFIVLPKPSFSWHSILTVNMASLWAGSLDPVDLSTKSQADEPKIDGKDGAKPHVDYLKKISILVPTASWDLDLLIPVTQHPTKRQCRNTKHGLWSQTHWVWTQYSFAIRF